MWKRDYFVQERSSFPYQKSTRCWLLCKTAPNKILPSQSQGFSAPIILNNGKDNLIMSIGHSYAYLIFTSPRKHFNVFENNWIANIIQYTYNNIVRGNFDQ